MNSPSETLESVIAAIAEMRARLGDRPMDDRFARRYAAKWELVRRYRPRSICEIGVRAGYFARTMLAAAGAGATYYGIDNDSSSHGGAQGAHTYAEEMLQGYQYEIQICDSHSLERLPADYDLIHVDGDHSYEGCMADLELVLPHARGVVLVDDFVNIQGVRDACRDFMLQHPNLRCYFDAGESCNGTFVIEVSGEDLPSLPR